MPGRLILDRRSGGFTLVELLVVLLILGVVGTIVTRGLVGAMQSTRQTQARVEAMAELQRGAERMSRELRAACPIVGPAVEADEVTAAIQRGGDQLRHTYRWDTGTATLRQDVVRDDAGTWVEVFSDRVLMQEVDDVTFAYFDGDGATATMAADVRAVELRLRRDLAEQDPIEVTTLVSLRNGGRSCG